MMKAKRQRLPLVIRREDRASFKLWKEDMQKTRDNAEVEMKRRLRRMAASERTKFKRFLRNVQFLGDVGKAAGKSRVSRKLLDKWMDPKRGVSWSICTALNEAQAMLHCGRSAKDVLWQKKIRPELERDAELFGSTGQRDRESKVIAKLAAKDLKAHRWDIAQAAVNNDRGFFIDLGRILSGELSGDFYDKLDADIAKICIANPGLSTHKLLKELQKRSHHSVEEQTIRTRKTRLGLTKRQTANCDKT